MRKRTRAAAVLAIVGLLAAGCIDESDAGHEAGTVTTTDHETPAVVTDSAAPALSAAALPTFARSGSKEVCGAGGV